MGISSLKALLLVFLSFAAQAHAHAMLLGEERLSESQYAKLFDGKRIGILAHNASRDHAGIHIVDRLAAMKNVQLKMIFAPEHGYRSINDDLTADSKDSMTGLPVYSLYGPRKAPTPEMLAQLDLVIIDLQDIGLRYYTYPATMVYTMKACKTAGIPVVILDRPNPLGGEKIEGAVLEKSLAQGGLTNLAPIPTRHGLTMGELAQYFNLTMNLNLNLTVIPMSGWARTSTWEETGMKWTPPSPALVSPDQVFFYAIFGTLEAGNLAVGRGQVNDFAFRIFGAPWVTVEMQKQLIAKLQALKLAGFSFTPHDWTPDRAAFEGKPCRGFQVKITRVELQKEVYADPQTFTSLTAVLQQMNSVMGVKLNLANMVTMLGARWVVHGIEEQANVTEMMKQTATESVEFLRSRAQALIY